MTASDALPGIRAKLWELYRQVNEPTLAKLEASADLSDLKLSTSTAHDLLKGKARNSYASVRAFVVACERLARSARLGLDSALFDDDVWRRIYDEDCGTTAPDEPTVVDGDGWSQLVEHHTVWKRIDAEHADQTDNVRRQATAVVRQLSQVHRDARETLTDDRWHDRPFAHRMSRQIERLIDDMLRAEQLNFSPVEAAVLSLAPPAYQAFRARQAARLSAVGPTSLDFTGVTTGDRADYERFLRPETYRRLVDRAGQRGLADRVEAGAEIGWWLFHRWVAGCQPAQPLRDLLKSAPLDDSIRIPLAHSVDRVVRAMRLPPEELRGVERLLELQSVTYGVHVRERLIGLLLTLPARSQ